MSCLTVFQSTSIISSFGLCSPDHKHFEFLVSFDKTLYELFLTYAIYMRHVVCCGLSRHEVLRNIYDVKLENPSFNLKNFSKVCEEITRLLLVKKKFNELSIKALAAAYELLALSERSEKFVF